MSSTEMKTVSCPSCNYENNVTVYKTINGSTDGKAIKEKMLSGELFRFKCQNCGHEAMLNYPVLYNDMDKKFMVFYIPEIDRTSAVDEKLEKEFAYEGLNDITRRLAGSFNEFKEKVHIFDSGFDDCAMEIAKVALYDVVSKRTGDAVKGGYFSKYSEKDGTIGFTFFVGEENQIYVQTTRVAIYKKSAEIAAQFKEDTGRKFVLINSDWARNVLYIYKKKNES